LTLSGNFRHGAWKKSKPFTASDVVSTKYQTESSYSNISKMKTPRFAGCVATTLLLLVSISVALAAPDQATNIMKSHFGKITRLDQNARTLTVHWAVSIRTRSARSVGTSGGNSREITFKTTDKTTYTVGSNNNAGTWSDLKIGAEVRVSDHAQGYARVADSIEIASSP
jgi:hypothetical protein